MKLPTSFLQNRQRTSLVENRTTYDLDAAQINIFETERVTEGFKLDFGAPILASMIQGKKVMRVGGKPEFVFLPGESVMVPAQAEMRIDFPEASTTNPTRCLALVMENSRLDRAVAIMNTSRPKVDGKEWTRAAFSFHFAHDPAIHQIIQRLIFLCAEDHIAKDYFVSNMLDELLVRIAETESRYFYLDNPTGGDTTNDRLAYVLDHIRTNLGEKLTVADLSRRACLSESHFGKVFRNEIGMTPVAFIREERLQLAARLLVEDRGRGLNDVWARCGFNSPSYFCRSFRARFGMTPTAYRARKVRE